MPIIAKKGETFEPAPAGAHAGICVDIVDLGVLQVTYGKQTKEQHKVRICWQIDENMEDGKPFLATKRYTLSLHEKAALRKDLESWRGKPFTDEELKGFDLEVLLNKPCLLNINHTTRQGSTYADVTSIMRLPKAMTAPTPRDYVRVCDRKEGGQGPETEFGGISDDDVPF